MVRSSHMKQTSHYQLNQYEASDRILHGDFNSDNQKIDAALKAHADILAHSGNCKIVLGSYTGDGTYGAANPRTLTFDGKPFFVAIHTKVYSLGGSDRLLLVRGADWGYAKDEDHTNYRCNVTWGDRSVTWYPDSRAYGGANGDGVVYCYIALLAE